MYVLSRHILHYWCALIDTWSQNSGGFSHKTTAQGGKLPKPLVVSLFCGVQGLTLGDNERLGQKVEEPVSCTISRRTQKMRILIMINHSRSLSFSFFQVFFFFLIMTCRLFPKRIKNRTVSTQARNPFA